jgi:hypothetical protein
MGANVTTQSIKHYNQLKWWSYSDTEDVNLSIKKAYSKLLVLSDSNVHDFP